MNGNFTACIDCEQRQLGCHSTCSKYLEEREKRDAHNEHMHKRRKDFNDFCFVRRTMKARFYKEI